MRWSSPLIWLSLTALLGTACKAPEAEDQPAEPIALEDAAQLLAEQVCTQWFSCECQNAEYSSQDVCVSAQTQSIQETIDQLLAEGGVWNEACAGELGATWAQWECLGPTRALQTSNLDVHYACPVIKGTLGLGSECQKHMLGDNCAQGSSCLAGVCIDSPTVPVPVGGVCEYEWEDLPCVAGSWCVYSEASQQRVCDPLPQIGDACQGWCGPSSQDLVCGDNGLCEAAPGEGESCADQLICGPGLYCDGGLDFTCTPRTEVGGGCGADAVCPVDASCLGNICVADPPLACGLVNF